MCRTAEHPTPAASESPERAIEHEDMTEELADVLSTPNVTVEYRVEISLEIG